MGYKIITIIMNKLLTLVIPTYNMEKYLRRCLDSLIVPDEQMQLLEVLIINDGSKDSSSKIAHEYQDKYPDTFKVIDKENGNYGSCINRGLKEAKGKYIKILDADDSFDPKVFSSYLYFLQNQDADLVVSNFIFIFEDGKIGSRKSYNLGSDCINQKYDITIGKLFCKKNIQMHGIAYKTCLLRDMNYVQTEGISYTDQEWSYTPMFRVRNVSYFSGYLYLYLIGRAGQTMDPSVFSKSINQNEICVIRKLKDYLELEASTEGGTYYTQKWIINNLMTSYRNYLPGYHLLEPSKLISFDDKVLAMSPEMKDILDDILLPYTKYHFIKEWRRNNKVFKLSPFFNLVVFWSRGIDHIFRRLKINNS